MDFGADALSDDVSGRAFQRASAPFAAMDAFFCWTATSDRRRITRSAIAARWSSDRFRQAGT